MQIFPVYRGNISKHTVSIHTSTDFKKVYKKAAFKNSRRSDMNYSSWRTKCLREKNVFNFSIGNDLACLRYFLVPGKDKDYRAIKKAKGLLCAFQRSTSALCKRKWEMTIHITQYGNLKRYRRTWFQFTPSIWKGMTESVACSEFMRRKKYSRNRLKCGLDSRSGGWHSEYEIVKKKCKTRDH
jgi:hypothetical protein